MEKYLEFAKSLAEESAEIARKYFSFEIQETWKEDNTPLTKADTEINDLVIKRINETYPEHSIYGEEKNDKKENSKYIWVCDPIDGTMAFSCGLPILAQENIEAMIPVSVSIAKPGSKYFLLRALGDSMDKSGINDGDIVIVRQQSNAENGQKVVALIDDSATIKEFYRKDGFVVLKPNSTNSQNQPIILTEDFKIQGIVISVIPKL